jgi:nitroreductase
MSPCPSGTSWADRLSERLPNGTFLVGLSSIHWREAWKYGERAFRYCQHDAGHALAAIRYAAAALGWSAGLLDTCSDDDLAGLFGLDRADNVAAVVLADREHPDAGLLVHRRGLPPPRPDAHN